MNCPEVADRPSICEPPPPMLSPERRRIGIIAFLMSLLALWIGRDLVYPCEHNFHHQIDSPVLAIELSSNRAQAETVLTPACEAHPELKGETTRQEAHRVLLRNTIADLFLIPLYALFIWTFGSLFAVDSPGTRKFFCRALAATVVATAVADYVEDVGIFRSLRLGPSDTLAILTAAPSRIKWTTLGLSLLLTTVILIRSQNKMYSLSTRRLFALAYFVAGTLLVVGVWRPTLIELGMKVFGVIVAAQIIALLGPYVAPIFPADNPIYEDNFCDPERRKRVKLAVHE